MELALFDHGEGTPYVLVRELCVPRGVKSGLKRPGNSGTKVTRAQISIARATPVFGVAIMTPVFSACYNGYVTTTAPLDWFSLTQVWPIIAARARELSVPSDYRLSFQELYNIYRLPRSIDWHERQ